MLVFDIDDTLYQRSEPYLRAYRELFRGQYALDEEALVRANHRNKEEQFHLYSEGKISFEEMTVRRTQNTFRDMGVILSGDEAAHFEQVYSSYQNSLTLHPAFRNLLDTPGRNDPAGRYHHGFYSAVSGDWTAVPFRLSTGRASAAPPET